MKHLILRMLFMLAVIIAMSPSSARAELIDFSYQWTALPSTIASGTGLVSITPLPKGIGEFDTVAGTAQPIPSVSITTTSSALDGSPDVYGVPASAGKFQLALTLKDTSSGEQGTLTFGGLISGSLSSQTVNSLTATLDSPLLQTLTLGSHQYSVVIDAFALLPKPGATADAFLSASVSASSVNGPPPPPPPPPPITDSPEPSSFVLGGLALAGLAARRWSRLKQSAL